MRGRWTAVAALALAAACNAESAAPPVTIAPSDQAFCDAFAELLTGPLTEAGLDTGDPDLLRDAVERTLEAVRLLRDSAPEEVAGAAADVADAYEAGFGALAAHDYDLAAFDAEATAAERAALDAIGRAPAGPAVEDPNEVLESYFGEACSAGVTIPPDLLGDGGES